MKDDHTKSYALYRMVTLLWPPYGIGQAIIFSPCVFFLLYFFFSPRLFSAAKVACLPYFYTWCGLSANLQCRSEMCLTRLAGAGNGTKMTQKSPSAHHRTTLSGCIFATKACIDNLKNFLTAIYPPDGPQYVERWPTNGWDRFRSLGHPRKFQRDSRLAFVTAATLLTAG